MNTAIPKIALAITGASGFIYGLRLLEELAKREVLVHYTISPNARHIARLELGLEVDLESGIMRGCDYLNSERMIYHHHTHVGAAPASGSYGIHAAAIVPCSMGTLGRIATGTSEELPGRMADVALKERRPLILVPRETPYSTIQIRNMLTLSESGAIILPATPGFYHQPESIDDLINFVIARVLQHLGFEGKSLVKGGWGADPVAGRKFLEEES